MAYRPNMQENPSPVRVIYRSPQMARLVLNTEHLAYLRERHNLQRDDDFAQAIGIHRIQIGRIVRGQHQPGTKFIAGCLDVFGKRAFLDLFDVEPDAA